MSDTEKSIEDFVKERDEMLLSLDIDRMLEFRAKHNPDAPVMSNREIAEIALHKARTAAKSLPMEARKLSKDWLEYRGWTSLDDGDI